MALRIPQRMEKHEAPRISGTAISDWKYYTSAIRILFFSVNDVSNCIFLKILIYYKNDNEFVKDCHVA